MANSFDSFVFLSQPVLMSEFLPANIKFLRRKKGLTQESLAELLGTTRASVCAYEDGRAMPPYPKLKALAETLESHVEDMTELDLRHQKVPQATDRRDDEDRFVHHETPEDLRHELFIEGIPFAESSDTEPEERKGETWFPSGDDFPLKNCRILARKIEAHELADGSVYLIRTRAGRLLYRRVYDQVELRGVLVLTPEVIHLQTIDLPAEEVVEIWEFVAYQCNTPPRAGQMKNKLGRLLKEMNQILGED